MMRLRAFTLVVCGCTVLPPVAVADPISDLGESLSVNAHGGQWRARLSGTVELEGYAFSTPAPALLEAEGDTLLNPRFTALLDAQVGPRLYVYAQARIDRGFDPAADPVRARLDEYAIRLSPETEHPISIQLGKFATVVGGWVPRHLSWDNPLINAPLVYENLTGVWDEVPAPSVPTLLRWAHLRSPPPQVAGDSDKYLRLPVIWGPSYATGASVAGSLGRLIYAVEVKARALSSRPSQWNSEVFDGRTPAFSARIGWRPNLAWDLGVSASTGGYLNPEARPIIPAGRSFDAYRETVLGHDISFAWHHVQLWAEVFAARFAIPRVGNADTLSYYVEARYKFTPQLFGAVRWNQQFFGHLHDPDLGRVRWGPETSRVDLGLGYRFTAETVLKVEYSLQHQPPVSPTTGHLLAAQLVLRF